jgi:hypothetical protein
VDLQVPGNSKREETAVNPFGFFVLLVALFGLISCNHPAAASTSITCSSTTSTSSTSTSTSTCTDPTTGISITISPATVSVAASAPQQFTGSVFGGTNSVVTWKVNNMQNGNGTVGVIDASGLYHAPSTAPNPAMVKVTAVSFEDQNLSATANVTITPPPTLAITSPAPPYPVKVTSGPSAANSVTFSATESGGSGDTIYWCVFPIVGTQDGNGILGGNSTLGTISANGVFTPPPTPPIGSIVDVKAALSTDCTKSVSNPVTVLISGYSTSSLQGQFAFSVAGSISSGSFFRTGSFFADGAGNINGGLEDINEASVVASALSFTGTYSVASDGRGKLNFSDPHAPANLPANFDFVLVSGNQLQITGFDTSGTPTYSGTASGQAAAQSLSAFAGDPPSALSGTYVFDFTGVHGANALSLVGEFTADGKGHVTGGAVDVSDGGTSSPFQISGTSSYTVSLNGRGTLTLTTTDSTFPTLTFAFYALSKGAAKFVGIDTTQAVGGFTMQQAPNATFDPTSLNGNYAFLLTNSGATYASAGSFSADGRGNITGGVLDENSNGTPNANVLLSANTYTVASNGRGTASFTGGRTYVFYLGPVGTAVFQETDATHASDGIFAKQQDISFALSQIAGNYAVATTGLSGAAKETISGGIAADGKGGVSSGAADVNRGGSTTIGVGVTGSYSTSSSAERGVLTLNLASPLSQARGFGVYVVSPTQAFVLETDNGLLAAGFLLRQF